MMDIREEVEDKLSENIRQEIDAEIVQTLKMNEYLSFLGIEPGQNLQDFENMCAEYPSLAKALEHFKQVYDLTIDDWRNNTQ